MSKLEKESGDGLAIHYEKILKTAHDRPWAGTHRKGEDGMSKTDVETELTR